MEVYEVMLVAVPLWFLMVGFIFSLVFGGDILGYLAPKPMPERAESPRIKSVVGPEEEWASEYPSYEVARSRDRELVLQ